MLKSNTMIASLIKGFFKRISLIICLMFFIFNFLVVKAQEVNFSGVWILNTQQTNLGNLPIQAAPIKLTVKQKTDTISIERLSRNSANEIHSYVEILSLDGSSAESMTNVYTKKISSVNKLMDGQVLKETARYIDYSDKTEYVGSEVWTLHNKGNMLIIERMDDGAENNFLKRMVYDKQ